MLLFPPDTSGRVVKIYDALAATGDLDKFRSPQDAVDVIDDILRRLNVPKMISETTSAKSRAEDNDLRLEMVRDALAKAGYKRSDTDHLEHRYVEVIVERLDGLESFVEGLKSLYDVVDDHPIDSNVTSALLAEASERNSDLEYLRATLCWLVAGGQPTPDDEIIRAVRDAINGAAAPAKKRWWKRTTATQGVA